MPYSATCKYALRALAYISMRSQELGRSTTVLGGEVAAAEHIPPSFLSRVLRDLVRKGFIRSKPGRGGGYSLRVPPQEVRVTDIIAAIDEARDLTKTCVLGLGVCSDENPCELHEVWKRYRQVYLAALARLTLADLAATLKARQSPGSSATPPSSTGRPGVPVPLDRPAANRPPFEVR